jgi:type II secretory pathway component GspD/PulD (secretin)
LIILITPHVIRNRADARTVTEEFEDRIRGLQGLMSRIQKPNVRLHIDESAVPTPERRLQPSTSKKSQSR